MRKSVAFLLAPVALALAVSCAGAPAARGPSASLVVPDLAEIKAAYGYDFALNPYLEPSTTIRGKLTEFVVLRVDLELASPAAVTVDARLVAADGTVIAEMMDRERMKLFWSFWEGKDSEVAMRLTTIDRSYIPGPVFTAKAGKRSYYIVLSGKYPFPRPAAIEGILSVAGMDPVMISRALPELPTKKK